MFSFRTSGETHGPALVAVIEGVPAGLAVSAADIDGELARRQAGYGRGERMKIERDAVEILSGVRFGRTLGSPIGLLLRNLDWANWGERMSVGGEGRGVAPLSTARPGHADLGGALKFGHDDVRNVLERASARETAARVMAGAVARALLRSLGGRVAGHVVSIGRVRVDPAVGGDFRRALASGKNALRMADPGAARRAMRAIDRAKEEGTTLGGEVEVIARGIPPGLGSCASWEERLDGRLSGALMSIPAVKGVAVGGGFGLAELPGRDVHDEIFPGRGRNNPLLGNVLLPFRRRTNRAGGIEGGMTNGEQVVVRAAMKPIPTQGRPLRTVAVGTWEKALAHRERSDVCAVPACAVVAEAMVSIVLADAFLRKFGGDSMREILYNYAGYLKRIGGR